MNWAEVDGEISKTSARFDAPAKLKAKLDLAIINLFYVDAIYAGKVAEPLRTTYAELAALSGVPLKLVEQVLISLGMAIVTGHGLGVTSKYSLGLSEVETPDGAIISAAEIYLGAAYRHRIEKAALGA